MPIFLHKFVYSGTNYEGPETFQPGDPVPEKLLKNPIAMFHTDSKIDVPPKEGTPEHANADRIKRMQQAEDAAHYRRQEAEAAEAELAALNEQKGRAQAEAAGIKDYQPGTLPGAQAPPARTAPQPLRQPLRQPLPGPRRAASN